MRRIRHLIIASLATPSLLTAQSLSKPTIAQFMSPPSALALASAKKADRIAWESYEKGMRNIYAAGGPSFTPIRITSFLRDDGVSVDGVFDMLERDALRLDFEVSAHRARLRTLMARFKQMDLADACLVVMSERHRRCQVLTVDRRDFSGYRRNDREVIPFIAPPAR